MVNPWSLAIIPSHKNFAINIVIPRCLAAGGIKYMNIRCCLAVWTTATSVTKRTTPSNV